MKRITPRNAAAAGLAVAALALASTGSVAVAADPIASGTVGSNGKSDACLDQQHSGANPSATSPAGVLQIADSSCPTTTGATSTASGGGGDTESSTASTTNGSSNTSTSTSVTARSTRTRSATSSSTAGSVSAASASGLRIAHVRYKLLRAKQAKHLRVLVTLQDRKRRLVRFAIVSIGGIAGAKSTLSHTRVAFSNRKGQAAFVVQVTRSMTGKRLLVHLAARTPHSRALAVGSVLVPKKQLRRGAVRLLAST
jgi:hypothetical protein